MAAQALVSASLTSSVQTARQIFGTTPAASASQRKSSFFVRAASTPPVKLQKMMGTTPMELARSNLAKSGQISRNALCPCGSKKRYKRCCGKD